MMDSEDINEKFQCRDIQDSTGPQTQNHNQDEGKDREQGGSRCVLVVIVGLICALLLLVITLQHISITAERDLLKTYNDTVEELNHTISSLQHNNTDLKTDKHQLEDKYNSLSLEKHQLETRVNDLSAQKSQLQNNFNSLNKKKLELETRVSDLNAQKNQLQNNFNSLNQKQVELETRVNDLNAQNNQLQNNFNSLNQKKVELETRVTSLSNELKKAYSQYDLLIMSTEAMSWFDSRQFCRNQEADLVIIRSEEKQRFISSLVKEATWIGLSDTETEGIMKWVDNSPLNQGFWYHGEPNDAEVNEDCIELQIGRKTMNNWNDEPCSREKKGICEK